MLSDSTWNALLADGLKKYKPMLGKVYRDKRSNFVGEAINYTLSGQLFLHDGHQTVTAWAENCEQVKA